MTLLLLFAGAGESTPPPTPDPSAITRDTRVAGYEPHQLTLSVFEPVRGGTFSPRGVFEGNFQRAVSSWQFEINVNGGYGPASFSFTTRKRQVQDWLENGLGRHVECYNPRQTLVWSGFINKVRIAFGPLSAERGPLMDIGNRVSMIYTPLDTSVFPPVQGITRFTTITENAESQAKYGIIERVLNGGTIPDEDADQIQATYLAENAFPETNNQSLALGGGTPYTVTIECLGYAEYLKAYVYNQTANALSVTITDKLQAILAADPNGIFSTNYTKIATNNYLVSSYEKDNRDAQTLIQALLALGDINDTRYIFGIYEGQKAVYQAIPSSVYYQEQLSAPKQAVMDLTGRYIYPWDVIPGQFLRYNDFQISRLTPNISRDDPRIMFVEGVVFTAPWGLSLSGGKTDQLPQKLAKWGLGGL